MRKTTCKCGEPAATNSRYCLSCKALYMRQWRKSHPLSAEQRHRLLSRTYAGVYKRRGKIVVQPCGFCGEREAQMHHPDYSQPLKVMWFCGACHLSLHKMFLGEQTERV